MPLQLFGDFGVSAGFDQPADPYQNSQLAINYYPEISPSQTAKEPVALLGAPGLLGLASLNGIEVYKSDWQGNILQYATGRTNFIKYSDMGNTTGSSNGGNHGTETLTTGVSSPDGGTAAVTIGNLANQYDGWFMSDTQAGFNGSFSFGVWLKGSGTLHLGYWLDSSAANPTPVTAVTLTSTWTFYPMAYTSVTVPPGIHFFLPSVFIDTGDTATSFSACFPMDVHNVTYFGDYIATDGGAVTYTDYTQSGDHIVFNTAPISGAIIYQKDYFDNYVQIGTGNGTMKGFLINPSLTTPTLGSTWAKPSSVTDLQVRGLWTLPGRTQAVAVIGDGCYIVTYTQTDTSQLPVLSIGSKVGTLLTTAGQVRIRDNGLGGVAVIVDGPYGYYYVYGSAGSAVGPIGTFAQITDPNFLGSFNVAFIDGWWIFQQPYTQKFYTNSAPYSTTFDASYYAYKDSFSDNLVALMESKEELWLIGEETTEIWYDAGGQYFPFSRLVGTLIQVGCKAPYSVARFSTQGQDGLIWLGRSDRGENVVVRTTGFTAQVVSTPAVSNAITQLTYSEDAFGFTYEDDGHEFYELTFPTADVTWVYDGTMPPELAWTQRPSYDPYAQQFHRNRANAYMQFANMRVVGDYQNGCLYQLTRNAYSDAAWPLIAIRRTPFVWDQSRTRVFSASLQVDFAPGVGNNSGTWNNPQAQLRISKDYGTTFGQPRLSPLGKTGNYLNRCMWRQLGFSRGTVAEIQVIDPVKRDIVGATLRAMDETAMGNL
jgi:hypothetical protein